jgi:two-component system response regulator
MKEKKSAIDILVPTDYINDAELVATAVCKGSLTDNVRIVDDGEEALEIIFSASEPRKISMAEKEFMLVKIKDAEVVDIQVLQNLKIDEWSKLIPAVITTCPEQDQFLLAAKKSREDLFVNSLTFENFVEEMRKHGLYWVMVNEE